jgi:hypothetical protein
MRPVVLATKEDLMLNSLDLDHLFALFGKSGETMGEPWHEAFCRKVREAGHLVAVHETLRFWPGCMSIYSFQSHFFVDYKSNMSGAWKTFDKAARDANFFYVTEEAPNAWIASEVLAGFQMPAHWRVMRTNEKKTFILPLPPDADGRLPMGEDETPLAQMVREMEERLRATGITVVHEPPPVGPQPLVATFHRARNRSTKRDD